MRLKDGSEVEDPRLDRLVQFDERSREYPIMTKITRQQREEPRSWTWDVGWWLNQRNLGACVGYAFTHELLASPIRVAPTDTDLDEFAREEVFHKAQHDDPWAGCYLGSSCPIEASSDKYEGTSILAGIRTIQELGYINEYRWAFGEDDLWLSLSWFGPVVLGINWYEGMFNPDSEGFIRPTGQVAGGHAIVAYRTRAATGGRSDEWYEVWNSWGDDWGGNADDLLPGTARISREDMRKLLSEQGEACVPVVRTRR